MGEKQKRAVIIGASRVNKKVLKSVNITPNDLVICCDGGYYHCDRYNIEPDVVLGDFDSIDVGTIPSSYNIIKLNPEKDDTDTIYAIRYAIERGYTSIALIGIMGGRVDHSFASIQTLLFVHSLKAKAIIYDTSTTAFLLVNGSLTLPKCKNSYLSVFSIEEKAEGVSIKDSKYPLKDATVYNNYPIGVSNEFVDSPVEISVKKGKLLIMITTK